MESWTIPKRGNICNCPLGYIGQYCEIDVCAGYCLNGGTCTVEVTGAPKCNCPKIIRTTTKPKTVYTIWVTQEYYEHVEYKGLRCEREVVTKTEEKEEKESVHCSICYLY